MTFRLYGETLWISPYVFSSWVALREKGVPFETAGVALVDGAHRSPAYQELSLTSRVPALEHDGFHLAESAAIAEYLEEALPPPGHPALFPADRRARARARQIMGWLRSDLGALRDERSTVTMFYRLRLAPLTAAGERDARKLCQVTEQALPAGNQHLFGAWSLADSELAFMLHRLLLNGHEVPARVRAYAEAQWQRPSARSFVELARPAVIPDSYWGWSGTPRLESLA
jgi:glutathione S-transferase